MNVNPPAPHNDGNFALHESVRRLMEAIVEARHAYEDAGDVGKAAELMAIETLLMSNESLWDWIDRMASRGEEGNGIESDTPP